LNNAFACLVLAAHSDLGIVDRVTANGCSIALEAI
jgi:hypothetical protein|tara:strand:+ start:78 stop:182 length:105 start_codon:yes stop_codon:yes gene_type:complete